PVVGLTAANLSLSTNGSLAGTQIIDVTGFGTTWTVTVSTGTGNGDLGVNLVNTNGLTDLAGNPVTALPFTGQTQPIRSPIVQSMVAPPTTNGSDFDYVVPFNQPVAGVQASNFQLRTSPSTAASIGAVTGSGNVWTVTVTGISGPHGDTIQLQMVNN